MICRALFSPPKQNMTIFSKGDIGENINICFTAKENSCNLYSLVNSPCSLSLPKLMSRTLKIGGRDASALWQPWFWVLNHPLHFSLRQKIVENYSIRFDQHHLKFERTKNWNEIKRNCFFDVKFKRSWSKFTKSLFDASNPILFIVSF